jgi:hypothetical protein
MGRTEAMFAVGGGAEEETGSWPGAGASAGVDASVGVGVGVGANAGGALGFFGGTLAG